MTTEIAEARPDELETVLALLTEASLPREGVAEHFRDFLVAREGGQVTGAVGMERYGESVLLRSLVVAPARRGEGLGRALAERLLDQARRRGGRQIFLLTETAPNFFARLGFRRIARDEADAAVQVSPEFRTCCPQSAVCMRREI
ncbi:MAG TPA: arsenic resistance N-acetyltransferase ArsN2 [Methylomirabilota bacterium]|jgi:amino-acid N-acetyltransferase|nr:arsenic resistance N-acetyltransferase ArsN2 [Methylomirabilota bacterium]